MFYLKRSILLLIILFISAQLNAQPLVKFNSLDDEMPMDPNVKVGKLANGMKYYIRENKKPEKRAEIYIVMNTGSIYEDNDQMGLAHFIEHMCFNGTKNFPKDSLVNFLESTGLRFGADLNANTGFDRILYLLTIPTDKEGMLDKGLQVLEDWAHNVSFDSTEIEKERGVIMEEWRLYRGAQARLQKIHAPYIFYKSKYADRMPIGEPEIIQKAPRSTFLRFYNEWFRPNLQAIVAVGDFDKNQVEKLIQDRFSKLTNPDKPREPHVFEMPAHQETLVSIAKDKELPYSMITFFFKNPDRYEGTFRSYKLSLEEQMLSQMLSQRMSELTRKAPPPYLFAAANSGRFLGDKRVFNVMGVVNTGGFNLGTETILTECFRAMQHGFTQSELERAKQEMMRGIQKSFDERDKTDSKAFAMECSRNFNEGEGMPGIAYEVELYKKFLPEISLDEVNSLVKTLIHKDNLVITISAPDKEGVTVPTKEEILSIYDNISKKDIAAYEDKVSKDPLMANIPKPGKVVDKKEYKELGITELKLSNGIKVLLKPTDFKNDEVMVQAYSPGGTSLVDDKDFQSASAADDLVNEAGLGKFSATDLEKMLSGKIANISPYMSQLAEGFQGSASPKDLETLFQLANLYFTAPRQDKESFESYMSKAKEQLKNSKQDPNKAFMDTLQVVMANYHYRALPTSEESLNQIDFNKAFEIYKDRFADAGDFTYIFIGSFTIDKIVPLIETYIASLPTTHRVENWKDLNIKMPKGLVTREVKKGIEPKSTVRLVFSGDYSWNTQTNYELSSLIELLNIRMREIVREEKGGTYGVYARAIPSHYPTETYRIDINFGCDPKRAEELTNTIYGVIKELQDTKASDENLKKIKEIQKREREKNLKENRFWMNAIYSYWWNNDDPMQILDYYNKIEKLSAETLQQTAKKYLNMSNYAKFVLYPEK